MKRTFYSWAIALYAFLGILGSGLLVSMAITTIQTTSQSGPTLHLILALVKIGLAITLIYQIIRSKDVLIKYAKIYFQAVIGYNLAGAFGAYDTGIVLDPLGTIPRIIFAVLAFTLGITYIKHLEKYIEQPGNSQRTELE